MKRIFKKVGIFLRLSKNRIRDRKTHVYRECPYCHAILRLPKESGTHMTRCPRCRESFSVSVK